MGTGVTPSSSSGQARNMLLDEEFDHLETAIVEPDRFGGTCLNRGCIPRKMFAAIAADAAEDARAAELIGVHTCIAPVDWKAVRDRVFSRIDPRPSAAGWLMTGRSNGVDVKIDQQTVRFVQLLLQVGDERITADIRQRSGHRR